MATTDEDLTDTEIVSITIDDKDALTTKRTRRRRRRRGGGRRASGKSHWWSFAPHPNDEDGKAIEAGDFGYPVVLPSGQSVFLLHEAKNPEYAQTFLAEDKYRPAMPSPPSAITEDSVAFADSLGPGPSLCYTKVDDDSEELWDDAMSTCSELSAASTGLTDFFCATSDSPVFRDTRISSLVSDLGSTDASSSSIGASSSSWSSSSSSISSLESSLLWPSGNCHDCMTEQAYNRTSEDDAIFLAQYSDEVDRLTQDASETNDSTENLASRQARREPKKLRKVQEAKEREFALKSRRRAEHEKRERRNKVKQERREAKAAVREAPLGLGEVEVALLELGVP